jgi:RNA polymerase sigma-70 factor, ECF subfamily
MSTKRKTHPPPAITERYGTGTTETQPSLAPVRDAETRRWKEQLREGHPRYDETVAVLHDFLRRVAVLELTRRRRILFSISGPEFEDLAQQAANDALIEVLGKLDRFRGMCRFTTWAYKFAVYEVASQVAGHAWRRHQPPAEELDWDELVALNETRPEDHLDQHAQLAALSAAISGLGDRQRTVFVAVALNDVPVDVLALELRTNRNAIYKNLFDARQRLRTCLAAAGHPVGGARVSDTGARNTELCAAA